VKIGYKNPNPFWPKAFSSIIPRHVFAPFKGARSREAPANLKPVGTGPYRVVDFKPGDLVRAEVFPGYHEANWPFFDRIEMKDGDGERSSVKAPHPFLTDHAVRTALSLLVDRASIQEQIYGRHGQATANYLNAPPVFRSKNTRWEFSPEKAAKVLDDAGWKRG